MEHFISPDAPLTRPYPKKVLFIIANEFCERFSYYGLRTVLVLYFRSVLGFTDAGSTVSYHIFATLCYLTPILGAILADSILGKYKTILYLSMVYFIGELMLVFSSIFWDLGMLSILFTWLGLVLIGIGTGGIKPCVAAFAGDQFLPNERAWRESFFSLFYAAINVGSLISMFITPILRSNYKCVNRTDCYPYAFGLPCMLLFTSTIVFFIAHNYYYKAPLPEQNPFLAFTQCVWLALKRKMAGYKRAPPANPKEGEVNHIMSTGTNPIVHDRSITPTTSNSSLSITSSDNETKPVAVKYGSKRNNNNNKQVHVGSRMSLQVDNENKRDHWLYLASDKFDKDSIEDFRSVLGLLLLFLPTCVYWSLFDQQGSLWTLQATRMDGRVWNTNYTLEPDQMMVANPVLLLTSIPLFQFVFYPMLNKCNLITTPIQRMTTGGLIMSLSFVASSLIEFQMQHKLPVQVPRMGESSLLLVNGLSDCSMIEPKLVFNGESPEQFIAVARALNQTQLLESSSQMTLESLNPLTTRQLNTKPEASAKLSFKLASQIGDNSTVNLSTGSQLSAVGCPFDSMQLNELTIAPQPEQSVKLLYVDQGNGKLAYKLFNESLVLPPAGKARVRLLYEFFGSFTSASKRSFYLVHYEPTNNYTGKNQTQQQSTKQLEFKFITRDGQVLLSDYLDIDITGSSQTFTIYTNDSFLNLNNHQNSAQGTAAAVAMNKQLQQQQQFIIKLEPGTRNLLIMHQMDAKNVQVKQQLLQDNNYRISLLWQFIPYTLISMSEVMFSITILEFAYANAPINLKSIVLATTSLTVALGNIFTVAVESIHPFSNLAHDFLFYAAIMILDMILFAIIGYNFKPYRPYRSQSRTKSNN